MLATFFFYSGYLMPLTVVIGGLAGGVWTFLTPVWVYGVSAGLDVLYGAEPLDPRGEPHEGPVARPARRIIPMVLAPVLAALVGWCLWLVAAGSLGPLEWVGLAISLGVATGALGITGAHELVHRPGRFERALGVFTLALVSYMHFRIEHVYGHHRRVATREDPASARLGESIYAFLPRTLVGSLLSAWRLEAGRLARRGRPTWSPGNRMIWYLGAEAAIYAGLAVFLGPWAALFFLVQSFVAVVNLEIVNYLEHYGLERRRLGTRRDGGARYEPVSFRHSWNTNSRVTNFGLFNLGRHGDHHLAPGMAYPYLQNPVESPQLPTGYAGTFLLALVPPLWRRVMDERAKAWA